MQFSYFLQGIFTLVFTLFLHWFHIVCYTGSTVVLHWFYIVFYIGFLHWFQIGFTIVFYIRLPMPMPSQPASLHPACAQPTSQLASRQPSRLPSPQATPDGKLPWHLLLQLFGFIKRVANISYLEARPCIKKIEALTSLNIH